MSSSPLINESSDPSSPSLPLSVMPCTPPQPSSSSLPTKSISESPPKPTVIPSLTELPVKLQLTETIEVNSLIQESQEPISVPNDTDLQLTERINPDPVNIPMDVEEATQSDVVIESQTPCEFQTELATESSINSKHAVGREVELQDIKAEGNLDVGQPLPSISQPEPEPLNQSIKAPLAEPEKFISELNPINEPMETSQFEVHPLVQPTQSPLPPSAQSQPSYHLKWIKWKGNKCPIVTQNENGPCPLIAIINVLLVKGRLRLPPMMEVITANQLIEYLGDCILENIPKGLKEEEQLNYEQNMHDAIAILPKLQTGLDVNVRFTGVSDFEYTPELIFFDLLHIPLYHGWLVDPNDAETATSIGNLSYNQLVDKIITHKTSTRPELAFEALVVEHFLERTASQLTYHGLSKLNQTLKDDELSVLFRNNHFITLLKSKDQLYQLVTDQGFLTESRVVWETLNNIENDGLFVDGDFIPVPPKRSLTAEDQQVQVDQDYLIALSLQEEQKKEFESEKEWETYKSENGLNELSEQEFARKLQEEEKRKAGQLTNYQGDRVNGQSSQFQNLPQSNQLNQSHNYEPQRENARSPHPGNKRSQSLPSRKNSNKPDDKSNTKCSMM